MKTHLAVEDILNFIERRKARNRAQFNKNTAKEKCTSDPAELVRLTRSNMRIYGKQKELNVLHGFITRETSKDDE